MTIGPRDLFDAAWSAMQKTHSPYSKFPVGARHCAPPRARSIPVATSKLPPTPKGGALNPPCLAIM